MIVLFCAGFSVSYAQRTITGKVVDENNQALPGTNVQLKGTTTGTSTDVSGTYSLSASDDARSIVFSSIGYESQEILIDNRSVIDVTLKPDVAVLKEVVVVGYGSQSRETLTTAVSKLDDRVLENIPFTNGAAALQGTLSGVRVQTNSGQPGAAPNIVIRGGTSINSPNSSAPLFIIDGVYRDNMNDINTTDIKSIQVLKDAAATAIYGAQGSNGVVIVVTNSGSAGKIRVNYRYDHTISTVGKTYDLLRGKDEAYFARTGLGATSSLNSAYLPFLTGNVYLGGIGNDLTNRTSNSLQPLTPDNEYKLNEGWESIPDPLNPSQTLIFSNVNWQDLLFRTANSNSHSVTLSGGTEKARVYLGLGYQSNEGIAIQTNYKRLSLNLNGELQVSDKIDVFARVMYANTSDQQVSSIGNIFKSALIAPSTNKLFFEDGSLATGRNFGYASPFYQLSTYNPNNKASDLTLIVGGNAEILPGLAFSPQLSFRQRGRYERNFQRGYYNGPNSFVTSRNASGSFNDYTSPQAQGVLSYVKSFDNVHNFDIKVGVSYFEQNVRGISARGSNAATDIIPTLNASATPVNVSGIETQQKLIGYFSRVSYDYQNKYLLNASLRYDGASNLGQQNKWGIFPGVSVGWNLHQEEFWNSLSDKVSRLKLRASYGVTGNISGLGLYQAQGEYSAASLYGGNGGIQITQLPNQNLRWEQSKTLDFGMDIGLFNNRVGILFDYYRRVTDNLLTTLSLPPSSGFESILTNFGSLENRGYEVEINTQILPSTSPLKWNLAFNMADVQSKILQLPENGVENNRVGGEYVYDPARGDYAYLGGLQEGGRIGDLYGYKQVSIYATDEEAAKGPVDQLVPRTNKTKYGGDVNWLDVDGNGIIDSRDRVYMGNSLPRFTGGFINTLAYKNLSLLTRMDYTTGATIYYETGARLAGNFSGANAIGGEIARSWQKQGDITDIPRYYWADQNGMWNVANGRQNSRYFQKTDFLCLREVTLSYALPQSLLNRIKLADVRLHVTGNNLKYFTDYDGLSPEQTDGDTAYPNPRSFIFGASITF